MGRRRTRVSAKASHEAGIAESMNSSTCHWQWSPPATRSGAAMHSRHVLRLASFFLAPQAKAQRAWWALNSLTRLRRTVNVCVQLLSAPATGLCLAPRQKPLLCSTYENQTRNQRCVAVRCGSVECIVMCSKRLGPALSSLNREPKQEETLTGGTSGRGSKSTVRRPRLSCLSQFSFLSFFP